MIVIVFGLPGSGKSYFALHLSGMINAQYISNDRIRKDMFDKRTYSMQEKLSVYDEMLARMREAVEKYKNVVLDATFYNNDIRKKFVDGAKGIDDVFFIETKAEESLIIERLKKPREDSEADSEVYQKIKNDWELLSEDHLTLQSTNDNVTDMLERTADYLFFRNDKETNQ